MITYNDLHDYQTRAIDALYGHDSHYLVAPMGAGKTITALAAIAELVEDGVVNHPLVIAPKRVAQFVWAQEAAKFAPTERFEVSVVLGTPKKRLRALEASSQLHVATYDNIQWLVKQPEFKKFDLVLFDEASKLKNPKGKRSKELFKHMDQFKVVWGMGGSPSPNGVPDLFNQAKIITKGRLWGPSYWKWQNTHYWQDRYTYKLTPKMPHTEVALREQFATIASHVDVDEIPREASETHLNHPFTLSAEERRHYANIESTFTTVVDGQRVSAPQAAVAINKLRQITSGFIFDTDMDEVLWFDRSRLDALDELIEQTNEPLLVAYQFVPELQELLKRYPGTPYLGGGSREADAEQAVADWNAGRLPLLFIHPQSAGHGLNLQHGGRQIVWLSLPWSLEAYEQTIARLSRQGQKHQVMVHYIMGEGTVDWRVLTALKSKTSVQDAVINAVKERGEAA